MLGGGLALGLPLGWVVKGSLMSLAARYLVLPHSAFWDGGAILPSALAAAAITAPVLAGPADALRRLSPLAVLRRDVSETRPFDWRTVWMFTAAVAIALVAAGGIAYGMIQAWKPALFLVAALTASAGIAWAIGGKHDRPWGARQIFGTIRYMSGASTGRKFDSRAYIKRWR